MISECDASFPARPVELTKRGGCIQNHWRYRLTIRRGCASWITENGKEGKRKTSCSMRIPGTQSGYRIQDALQYLAAARVYWLHSNAPAKRLRDAALSFPGESILILGHKHINALLMCALLS